MLLLTIGLPIMKIVLFPTRAVGRGGNWVIVGAAMIVAMMMVLWFGMQQFSDTAGDAAAAHAGADKSDAIDFDALAKLL